MTFFRHGIAAVISLGFAVAATAQTQTASGEWTQWRGPSRDGAAPSFTEPATWPEQLNQRWKVEVGTGYATPLVSGDRVYVFARQGENEVMLALDAATGKVVWQTGYPAPFEMNKAASRHGPGPKSTPVLAGGKLFAIGMTGVVTAFDAATGKQLWQKPAPGVVPLYTSHAFSPLVDGGVVIFHVGGHDKGALTAFDVNTGDVKWSWDGDGPGYGSPVVAEVGGTRQIVVMTQQKLIGVDVANGMLLWERPYVTPSTTNSITPLVYGQTIIVSGGNQPVVAFTVARRDNKWATDNVWENTDASYRMSNAVVAGDTLFSLSTRDMGQYFAIDAKTGKTLWLSEPRQAGNAAIVKGKSVFLSLEDDGELVVVRNSRTGFEALRRYKVADSETWAAPAVLGNRIFVKDVSTLTLWTLN
jgi:outer membrane protein assembly factor BamB